jgi:pyruvate dehydrogenase E2 component (dihydrolipoamide acetyltransferase)
MSIEFKLPELAENVDSADIVNILVQEGEVIAANDGVFEMETDKAVAEIPCPYAGKVTKIHVKKGQTVKVGQTLLTIEAEVEAATAPAAPKFAEPVGIETQPADADRSPGGVTQVPAAEDLIPAGPAARRLARELGVDLHQVVGSGKRGRITPEDVQAAVATPQAQPAYTGRSPTPAEGGRSPAPAEGGRLSQRVVPPGELDEDKWGPVRLDKMSKIRRTIAAQMVKSYTTIPHVTNFDDADVTDLEHLRKNIPPGYLGEGVKLTAMPFVLKAVAMALQQHPALNASIDDEKEEVIYKQYVNIGVAVDTPRGLVVPALRNVDRLNIPQIASQLNGLAQKARSAAFTVDDLRGGTFTVSNQGAIGGAYSTPIINHPETAILLLGRSRRLPVVREDKVEIRLMMPLSLSFDHRLVDGAEATRFLNDVIDLLQNPGKLLLAM